MVRHAREAGEFYGFRVPLDAEYKVGSSWAGDTDGAAAEPQTKAVNNSDTQPAASTSDPAADISEVEESDRGKIGKRAGRPEARATFVG